MKIALKYSHFYGEEYLLIHHKKLYSELRDVIKTLEGNYSEVTRALKKLLYAKGWREMQLKTRFKQTYFIKDKIAVEVLLGRYSLFTFDLFAMHSLLYSEGTINLGIEILSTKNCKHKSFPEPLTMKMKSMMF